MLKVLILGEGNFARLVASRLTPLGETEAIALGAGTSVRALEGGAGDIRLLVEEVDAEKKAASYRHFAGSALVLAFGPNFILPSFADLLIEQGLPVIPLAELAARLGVEYVVSQTSIPGRGDELNKKNIPSRVSIIIASEGMEASLPTRAALRSALELNRRGSAVTVFHRTLAVGDGINDALCQEVRESGVKLIRCRDLPEVILENDGTLTLRFTDMLLPEGFVLTTRSELLAVAEEYAPSEELVSLFSLLRWNGHINGLPEENNLHYWQNRSPRQGVYWATPVDLEQQLEVISQYIKHDRLPLDDSLKAGRKVNSKAGKTVEVDPYRCKLCLTCYRVCPHGAVEFADVPERLEGGIMYQSAARVINERCLGCGLCLNECPALAISWSEVSSSSLFLVLDGNGELRRAAGEWDKAPPLRITAFACRSSGYLAVKGLLAGLDKAKPGGADGCRALIEVKPVSCAGEVSLLDAWRELADGADGLIAWACHHDACRHLWGNSRLKKRWSRLRSELKAAAGREPAVLVQPVAAMESRVVERSIKRLYGELNRGGEKPGDSSRKEAAGKTERDAERL